MSSGTKPITYNIVRGFRGQMLYLASIHRGNGFRFTADPKQALPIATAEEANTLAERASREYGAKCTVVDTHEAPHVIKRAPAARKCAPAVGRIAVLRSNGARFAIADVSDDAITLEGWSEPITVTPRDFAIRYEVQS